MSYAEVPYITAATIVAAECFVWLLYYYMPINFTAFVGIVLVQAVSSALFSGFFPAMADVSRDGVENMRKWTSLQYKLSLEKLFFS